MLALDDSYLSLVLHTQASAFGGTPNHKQTVINPNKAADVNELNEQQVSTTGSAYLNGDNVRGIRQHDETSARVPAHCLVPVY